MAFQHMQICLRHIATEIPKAMAPVPVPVVPGPPPASPPPQYHPSQASPLVTVILQVLSQKGGPGAAKMLYQEDGDVLIMAGKFQEEFTHAVPAMFWILLFQVAPCHVYI